MATTNLSRIVALGLAAALGAGGAFVPAGPVLAGVVRVDGHEPRQPGSPGSLELHRRGWDGPHAWRDGRGGRPGPWSWWDRPPHWRHDRPPYGRPHWGWDGPPPPRWWAPRFDPVWIPGHWEWTGWGWAWVPGHWR